MRKHKVVILLTVGFLVGICILLYPAVSDYWNGKTQSRAIVDYESILDQMKPEVHGYTGQREYTYCLRKMEVN